MDKSVCQFELTILLMRRYTFLSFIANGITMTKRCDGKGILWLEPGKPKTLKSCPGCKICRDVERKGLKNSKLITRKEADSLCGAGLNKKDFNPTLKMLMKCVQKVRSDYVEFLRECLTVDQVAEMLSLPKEEVLNRLESYPPRLLGLQFQSYWLLPVNQFHQGRLVPNFEKVLAALYKPTENVFGISSWFSIQGVDLQDGHQRLSPREWLIRYLPLKEVLWLAENFDIAP